MKIGEKISKIRKMSRMTQEELAEKIHVSRQTISKWEKGTSSPDLESAVALCRFFQISLDDFMEKGGEMEHKPKEGISLEDLIKIHRRMQYMTILLLGGLFFLVIGIMAALFLASLSNVAESMEYMMYRYIVTGQYAYAPVDYFSLLAPAIILTGIGILLCGAYILINISEKRKESVCHEKNNDTICGDDHRSDHT
ncbi:MAG: helix-turn-helix transcriptional regulator [Eubacteriales bacterium]|nr:helix-turn-helix transcriptional regulator [Eubacteriales bacterium]